MALTFQYEKTRSSILGTIYRPIVQVFLFSAKRDKWYEVWMLVDSGADYTLLPRSFSERLGVDLKNECKVFTTSGIGGKEKVYFKKNVRARVGEWERKVPLGFLDREDVPPLLGRHMFLETFEVLLSSSHTITFNVEN